MNHLINPIKLWRGIIIICVAGIATGISLLWNYERVTTLLSSKQPSEEVEARNTINNTVNGTCSCSSFEGCGRGCVFPSGFSCQEESNQAGEPYIEFCPVNGGPPICIPLDQNGACWNECNYLLSFQYPTGEKCDACFNRVWKQQKYLAGDLACEGFGPSNDPANHDGITVVAEIGATGRGTTYTGSGNSGVFAILATVNQNENYYTVSLTGTSRGGIPADAYSPTGPFGNCYVEGNHYRCNGVPTEDTGGFNFVIPRGSQAYNRFCERQEERYHINIEVRCNPDGPRRDRAKLVPVDLVNLEPPKVTTNDQYPSRASADVTSNQGVFAVRALDVRDGKHFYAVDGPSSCEKEGPGFENCPYPAAADDTSFTFEIDCSETPPPSNPVCTYLNLPPEFFVDPGYPTVAEAKATDADSELVYFRFETKSIPDSRYYNDEEKPPVNDPNNDKIFEITANILGSNPPTLRGTYLVKAWVTDDAPGPQREWISSAACEQQFVIEEPPPPFENPSCTSFTVHNQRTGLNCIGDTCYAQPGDNLILSATGTAGSWASSPNVNRFSYRDPTGTWHLISGTLERGDWSYGSQVAFTVPQTTGNYYLAAATGWITTPNNGNPTDDDGRICTKIAPDWDVWRPLGNDYQNIPGATCSNDSCGKTLIVQQQPVEYHWIFGSIACVGGTDPSKTNNIPIELVHLTTDEDYTDPERVYTYPISENYAMFSAYVTNIPGHEGFAVRVSDPNNYGYTPTNNLKIDQRPWPTNEGCTSFSQSGYEWCRWPTATDYPEPVNNKHWFTFQVPCGEGPVNPDLSVEKVIIGPHIVNLSDTEDTFVTFQLKVINTGDTILTSIPVTDTFETEYLDFVSSEIAPSSIDENGNTGLGTIKWNNILAPGEKLMPPNMPGPHEKIWSVTFKAVEVTYDAIDGDADNCIYVYKDDARDEDGRSTPPETRQSCDFVVIGRVLPTEVDIDVEKVLVNTPPVYVSQEVTFDITITNTGNVDIVEYYLNDMYDYTRLTFKSAKGDKIESDGSRTIVGANVPMSVSNGVLVASHLETIFGTLDPGDKVVLHVVFTAINYTDNTCDTALANGRGENGEWDWDQDDACLPILGVTPPPTGASSIALIATTGTVVTGFGIKALQLKSKRRLKNKFLFSGYRVDKKG